MIRNRARRIGVAIAVLVLAALGAGCASAPLLVREGDPSMPPPWRLAVLPTQPPSSDAAEKNRPPARDVLEELRTCLVLEIPDGPFEVIPLPVVDRDRAPDLAPPSSPEEVVATARRLHADLILVPEVVSWRRRYYVLHAVARVGLEARLYDGLTGAFLFRSKHERVMNQGNLKIPAGYLAIIAGPILGLQHIHMSYMCNDVAREIDEDLLHAYDSIATEAASRPGRSSTDR